MRSQPLSHVCSLGRGLHLAAGVIGALALSACGSVTAPARMALAAVTPYQVEVVQGNFVSKEQIEALRPGMSRQQVREILGTPLLTDVFHENRWDYVFTLQRQGVESQRRHISLFFSGDVLDRTAGDGMPNELDFVAMLDSRKHSGKLPRLEATEEELRRHCCAAASAATPLPAAVVALPMRYPPLEAANEGDAAASSPSAFRSRSSLMAP